ncbi:phage tail length tape measure family protein [Agrobacterium vitis]|uniref:Bacteriophage tail tape measure N-terminal domain-containing protein n=1 Tax=Agrobacterium vitis TaxID=373 RepID=A0A7K1RE41_AGRVI|nr:phage tail length tape measure family protein [Agrobacterium vitis]MVA56265.1 hypothetical protein [Agrobacterium vitis]
MATPLKLAATVTLDASQVSAGAQTTKQAIAGIGTEATASATKLQKLVDAQLGLARPAANTNSRAAEIAAYGAELDRLQAKFDPLFAAQQKYQNALSQIDQAQRLGVVSASQAIDLKLKETSAYNALASAAANAAAANKRYAEAAVAKVTITPDRGADIAAYGAELDRLQAKFDPLFAAQKRYESALQQINQAQQVGAISASQAIDLKLKETSAYNALASAAANAAAANKRYAEAAVAKVTVTPDRGADIAAYGQELDRLRAKYNPLYAVTVNYKTAVSEIREAHKAGAISTDEMTAAISRNRQATLASIEAIKGRNSASNNDRNSQFRRQNLTYQVFDVAQSTALGMPLAMVAMQQGPQVIQMYAGQGGVNAALKDLGTIAANAGRLITPLSVSIGGLATVAAVGAAAWSGYLSSIKEVETAANGLGRAVAGSAASMTGLGQSMSSAGNYKGGGVDPRLTDILNTAAQRTPGYKVDAISGFRAGDPRFHGKGLATDVQLTDLASGKKLGNYQDASSFGSYEKFAQTARSVQMEKYPELANQFRWGGYFGGGKGKYGALDTMHFDLGGDKAGMGGGSWDKGLTSAQSSLWPGIQSSSTKAADALNQFSTGTTAANQNLGVFGNGLSQLGNGLTGLLSGGGSGLSSILSGLTSSSFKTNTTLGSFLTNGFDGGGFTGAGGRKEPAGVVHKGEVVWSQDDVARAGGAATVDAMRLGYRGYDKGGVVGGSAAASKSSNDNGGGNITVHNYSKANVQTEQTTDASGRRQTKFVIADMTGDAIGTKGGKASKTIEQQYGIKKKGIAR